MARQTPGEKALLGANLRKARENARISIRQFARTAGIGHTVLSRVERGYQTASDRVIKAYEKALDIHVFGTDVVSKERPAIPPIVRELSVGIVIDEKLRCKFVQVWWELEGVENGWSKTRTYVAFEGDYVVFAPKREKDFLFRSGPSWGQTELAGSGPGSRFVVGIKHPHLFPGEKYRAYVDWQPGKNQRCLAFMVPDDDVIVQNCRVFVWFPRQEAIEWNSWESVERRQLYARYTEVSRGVSPIPESDAELPSGERKLAPLAGFEVIELGEIDSTQYFVIRWDQVLTEYLKQDGKVSARIISNEVGESGAGDGQSH